MDNKTEYFTLKEDGVIGWIEKYGCKLHGNPTCEMCPDWNLQSAISNAIEVSNQIEVGFAIQSQIAASSGISTSGPLEIGKVYQLKCRIELDPIGSQSPKRVALVTFSEPSAGVEETQEDIFDYMRLDDVFNDMKRSSKDEFATEVRYSLYGRGGFIGDVVFLDHKEVRFFRDNYPCPKRFYSTNIPYRTNAEFLVDLKRIGFNTITRKNK